MEFAIHFIDTVANILSLAIVARILLSWFRANPSGGFYKLVIDTTQPILKIARKITPRTGMLDFAPLIALIGIDVIRYIIIRLIVAI